MQDHGAIEGDFVTFDSFSAIDGLDMNNEFEITTYVDANTYKVTHTSTASGSTSGGGGSGNANYQINIVTNCFNLWIWMGHRYMEH